ncbi:unnamed protein product [Candidula unifasciata]|uniref:Thioredoxin domain-containing protein n=1 Tax=Candidula unifasciata TaxID=100452 RepID=A0A8S3ZQU5_9EUPU|nr:unnamed protein product [Candidula unifasciata]
MTFYTTRLPRPSVGRFCVSVLLSLNFLVSRTFADMNSSPRLATRLVRNIRVATGCKSIHRHLTTVTNRTVLTCVQNPQSYSPTVGIRLKATCASKFEVINVQDGEDFKKRVIEASSTTPVIVDFHATWCGPCKVLGPRLEAILAEENGKVVMAKVDIDDNSELAMEYGVRSVPTVIGVKNGRVQNQFVGAIDDDQIRTFVDKLVVS